jgi:hypothetical protein
MRILSLGAGVQSSTLALMMARGEIEAPHAAIFADTQAEPQHVYAWLDWLEKLLPFPVFRVTHGSLERDILQSVNDPKRRRVGQAPFFVSSSNSDGGMLWRQCTGDYKLNPLRRKAKELMRTHGLKRVTMLIGISTDEALRMKPSRVKYIINEFPLIDNNISRQDCLNWMGAHGYPEPQKSACYFCPYTHDSRWREMRVSDSPEWQKAIAFDKAIRSGLPGVKGQTYLHRSMQPLGEVDFRNAVDMGQLDLFNNECEGLCGV